MINRNYIRKIPKSLNECVEPNPVTKGLWDWAERIETGGKILLGVIIAVGVYVGIMAGIEAASTSSLMLSDEESLLLGVFTALKSFAVCGIIAAAEYGAAKAISLLLDALASIVHNTNVSANVALYKNLEDFIAPPPEKEKQPETDPPAPSVETKPEDEEDDDEDDDDEIVYVEEEYIDVKCPACGENLAYPSWKKGTMVECINCSEKFMF